MVPILFTIGPFNVYAFGFFLCLAFVLSTFIIWKYAKTELKENLYLDIFLYTSIFSLIISRFFYIFTHLKEFQGNILRLIVIRETPGLSLLGGAIGGCFFLYNYAKFHKLNFWHIGDIFSIAGSFAMILAKFGEQLGGAGFGKPTSFFLGVRIVGQLGRHYPVELYEAIIFMIGSIILIKVYKKTQKQKWPDGLVLCLFTLEVAIVTFLLEFLKVKPLYLNILGFKQILALALVALSIWPLYRRIKIIKKPII